MKCELTGCSKSLVLTKIMHVHVFMHFACFVLQASVWRCAAEPMMMDMDPCLYGWSVKDGILYPEFGGEKVETKVKIMSCHCKGCCNTNICKCKKNDRKCTDLCSCANCENRNWIV